MEQIYLEAVIRDENEIGKSHLLRNKGFVPCVIYGGGKETSPLKIERSRLIKFMHAHHGGENVVVTLRVVKPGQEQVRERPAIVGEIQLHPVDGDVLHMDFHEVSLTEQIEVKVPIEGQGEPAGVKQEGGTLEHILWEVEVECLPTQIPQKFEVDLTQMKIGDEIHVKDLLVPEGVVIKHDPQALVFSLVPPYKEEILTPEVSEEAESLEPEVIKKEKVLEEESQEEAPKKSKEN